jgi:hypothetical protein
MAIDANSSRAGPRGAGWYSRSAAAVDSLGRFEASGAFSISLNSSTSFNRTHRPLVRLRLGPHKSARGCCLSPSTAAKREAKEYLDFL